MTESMQSTRCIVLWLITVYEHYAAGSDRCAQDAFFDDAIADRASSTIACTADDFAIGCQAQALSCFGGQRPGHFVAFDNARQQIQIKVDFAQQFL